MSKKRITILLSDEELEIITREVKKDTMGAVLTDRSSILKYALLFFVMNNGKVKTDLENKIIADFISSAGKTGKPEKSTPLSYMDKKEQREEEKKQRGIAMCNALEGNIIGEMCKYKVYEVTLAGQAVTNTRTENVYNLSEGTVSSQYYPSKEEWVAAKERADSKP